MSKIRKARKLRTPNVPESFEPIVQAPVVSAEGGETRSSEASALFDYSHTMGDLRRIAVLAGTFIVILVALTFVIR